MHTFSIWARPDLTYRIQTHGLSHRIPCQEGAYIGMSEEVHTPNVPKLLFPASFTRVGAQTVDPMPLPTPWTICGEALITSQVKDELWLCVFFQICNENLYNLSFCSYLIFIFIPCGVHPASSRLVLPRSGPIKPAWLRSRGLPPRGHRCAPL